MVVRRAHGGFIFCLALVLTACAVSTTPVDADRASHPAAAPTASARTGAPQILFLSDAGSFSYGIGYLASVTRVGVGGPDGSDSQDVIAPQERPVRLWSSQDGTVLAFRRMVTAPYGVHGSTYVWIVTSAGSRRLPTTQSPAPVAAVSPDGREVYATHGQDVVRYDLASGVVSNLCTSCVPLPDWPTGLAVSADGTRVAVSGASGGGDLLVRTTVSVVDTTTSHTLWNHRYSTFAEVQNFVDDASVIVVVSPSSYPGYRVPGNDSIDVVAGLGTGHVVDRPTGITGYGPVEHVAGTWWYYRDSWDFVTSVLTSSDLNPAHEIKVADRVDGTTSYDYHPIIGSPPSLPSQPPGPVDARPLATATG